MTAQTASPVARPARPTAEPVAEPPSLPWRRSDLHQAITLAVLGGIVVLTGWEGISQTDDFNTQLLWIVVGAAGVIVAGVGAALWLTAGFRNLRTRMLALPAETARRLSVLDAPPAASAAPLSSAYVTADSMTRWHRAACPLVAGKQGLRAIDPTTMPQLRPCGVCTP